MRKDYEELFARLEPPEPPAGLFDKIMARIREEERILSVKKRLFFFLATALASIGAFVPAVSAFRAEFIQSGLSRFLPLIFSDLGSVMANWQDFGLAVLESLPTTSLIVFLATVLVFLWSVKHFAQALKVVFNKPQFN